MLRYALEAPDDPATPSRWQPEPEDYAVGLGEDGKMASGGIGLQYGYKPDGAIDLGACNASIALTGDDLRKSGAGADTTVHGVLIGAVDAVRPPTGPAPSPSAVVAFDARQDQADLRGHVGNVVALRRCEGGAGFPPVAEDGAFPPVRWRAAPAFRRSPTAAVAAVASHQSTRALLTLVPRFPRWWTPWVDPGEGGKVQIGPVAIEKVGTTPTCNETVPLLVRHQGDQHDGRGVARAHHRRHAVACRRAGCWREACRHAAGAVVVSAHGRRDYLVHASRPHSSQRRDHTQSQFELPPRPARRCNRGADRRYAGYTRRSVPVGPAPSPSATDELREKRGEV